MENGEFCNLPACVQWLTYDAISASADLLDRDIHITAYVTRHTATKITLIKVSHMKRKTPTFTCNFTVVGHYNILSPAEAAE